MNKAFISSKVMKTAGDDRIILGFKKAWELILLIHENKASRVIE